MERDNRVRSLAVDSAGRVIAGGNFDSFAHVSCTSLVRLVNENAREQPVTARGRLVNVSSRAYAGRGEEVMIGGFVVSGAGTRKLVIRGIGPRWRNSAFP